MQNYNYIVMSPQKKLKEREEKDNNLIDPENMKFKLMPETLYITINLIDRYLSA